MQNYFSIQLLWVVKSLWLTFKKNSACYETIRSNFDLLR